MVLFICFVCFVLFLSCQSFFSFAWFYLYVCTVAFCFCFFSISQYSWNIVEMALNSRIHILLFFCIKSLFLLEYPFDLSRLTLFYCQTPSALSNSMFKFQVTTEILFQEQYFLMNENIIQCFDIRVFPKGWGEGRY